MFSLTVFDSVKDNQTNHRLDFEDWDGLRAFFYERSKMKGAKGGPDSSPLITPAVFHEGYTRSIAGVAYWGKWACVDVDDFQGSLVDVLRPFEEYEYLIYNTASSTKEKPKFRLVFPLTATVPASKIKNFWHSLNMMISGVADAQTKDVCRIFYVPADYPNAYSFIHDKKGKRLNPFELMKEFPWFEGNRKKKFIDRLPRAVQDELVAYRRSKMESTLHWTNYKDCPFFPQELGDEYKANAGVESGGNFYRLYRIMVSIAGSAVARDYPITAGEIETLCRQLDTDCGNIYKDRGILKEAENALHFAMKG